MSMSHLKLASSFLTIVLVLMSLSEGHYHPRSSSSSSTVIISHCSHLILSHLISFYFILSHLRVVELPKTEEGLGFNVMGGKEQNSPIYISRIIPGAAMMMKMMKRLTMIRKILIVLGSILWWERAQLSYLHIKDLLRSYYK